MYIGVHAGRCKLSHGLQSEHNFIGLQNEFDMSSTKTYLHLDVNKTNALGNSVVYISRLAKVGLAWTLASHSYGLAGLDHGTRSSLHCERVSSSTCRGELNGWVFPRLPVQRGNFNVLQ